MARESQYEDAELAYRYFPALFGVVISSSATKDERLRQIAELAKEARWYHERGISPEDALRGTARYQPA